MVVEYLEKIRDKYIEEREKIQSKLMEYSSMKKKYIEFIKLLEENSDSNYEAFTPRSVSSFEKRKVEELRIEQKNVELQISELEIDLENIENEINQIDLVIKEAIKMERRCFK